MVYANRCQIIKHIFKFLFSLYKIDDFDDNYFIDLQIIYLMFTPPWYKDRFDWNPRLGRILSSTSHTTFDLRRISCPRNKRERKRKTREEASSNLYHARCENDPTIFGINWCLFKPSPMTCMSIIWRYFMFWITLIHLQCNMHRTMPLTTNKGPTCKCRCNSLDLPRTRVGVTKRQTNPSLGEGVQERFQREKKRVPSFGHAISLHRL